MCLFQGHVLLNNLGLQHLSRLKTDVLKTCCFSSYHFLSFVCLDCSLGTMSHSQEFISRGAKPNKEINPCQLRAHLRDMHPPHLHSSPLNQFEICVYHVPGFLDSFTTYNGLLNNFPLLKYGFCVIKPRVRNNSFPVYKDWFYFKIA